MFEQVAQYGAEASDGPTITHFVPLEKGPAQQTRQSLKAICENQILSVCWDSTKHEKDLDY